jgi:hypothetical protein
MQLEWGAKKYIMDFAGTNPLGKAILQDQGGDEEITLTYISTKCIGYKDKILKLVYSLTI